MYTSFSCKGRRFKYHIDTKNKRTDIIYVDKHRNYTCYSTDIYRVRMFMINIVNREIDAANKDKKSVIESFIDWCDEMYIVNESVTMTLNAVYTRFNALMKEKGYKPGDKTYHIRKYDNETFIEYYIYEDYYGGTGKKYDNGLTKEDKPANDRMVSDIKNIINLIKKEYSNIKVHDEEYRGTCKIIFEFSDPPNKLKDGRKVEYFKNSKNIKFEKLPDGTEIYYKLVDNKSRKTYEKLPNGTEIEYFQDGKRDVKCKEKLPNGKVIEYMPDGSVIK